MPEGTGTIARDQLRAFIERIERLEEEKANLLADIREVYAEAKAMGFDPKIMRKVVSLRKMDVEKRQEEDFVLDTYLNALGMLEQSGVDPDQFK
ncbi:MAG: DUF2312 domain-containing protein [Rhodospirillaceae bacterium]|jgi:uncharacterized protein (UPF0335 family)